VTQQLIGSISKS